PLTLTRCPAPDVLHSPSLCYDDQDRSLSVAALPRKPYTGPPSAMLISYRNLRAGHNEGRTRTTGEQGTRRRGQGYTR
ncbi:hypothetical protein PENTCL1PPCAC_28653, partial [Pristionchus entomophagus]